MRATARLGLVMIASACCVSLGGCGGAPKGPPGYLVIAGGAVSRDNAPLFNRFVELAGPAGAIGVLPTASGVPDESGAGSAETIGTYTDPARVGVIDLTTRNPEDASNAAIVARIDACTGLWFTGGDQSRVTAVFRPEAGDTDAYRASVRVLERGGVIGGTSAGAAMMSDPMLKGGRSDRALVALLGGAPTPEGVEVGPGMGFLPEGVTDQHFVARGRMGRLISALVWTGDRFGYGVDEDCALVVDRAKRTGVAIVPGDASGVVVIDMGDAVLDADAGRLSGVRVSVMLDGDTIDLETGRVRPGGTRLGRVASGSHVRLEQEDPFRAEALTGTLAAVRAGHRVDSNAFGCRLEWSADSMTRFSRRGGRGQGAERLSVTGLRLNVALAPVEAGILMRGDR